MTAHRLNDTGRAQVRKEAGQLVAAGLAVLAADTGRVLMLQRALDPADPAGGTWEFPGGHVEDGETPLASAWREWAEETGAIPPPGQLTGQWASSNGVYQGIVWTAESEACVPVRTGTQITNPDDPDGDQVEAIAWWDPAQLPGNPAVRRELAADMDLVLAAFGWADDAAAAPSQGDESVCPCGTPVVFDEGNGWQHADGSVSHDDGESVSAKMAAREMPSKPGIGQGSDQGEPEDPQVGMPAQVVKAGAGAGPKAPAPGGAPNQRKRRRPPPQPPPPAAVAWPGWALDLAAAAYWAQQLVTGLLAAVAAGAIAEAWIALAAVSAKTGQDGQVKDLTAQARKWLTAQGAGGRITSALTDVVPGAAADGYAIGIAAARVLTAGLGSIQAGMDGWEPGATQIARQLAGEAGDGSGLARLLDQAGVVIKSIAATELDRLARILAIGTVRGASAADLARVISEFLSDQSRAEMIVATELARAANAAAVAAYRQAGIEQVIWVTAEDARVCALCDANEAAGPWPLGEAFPSGDVMPPAHPRCRCAIVPV